MRRLIFLFCLLPGAVLAQPQADHGPIMTSEDKVICLRYPDRARPNHTEGIVKLSLTVGTDGAPHDVTITDSSNSHDLDQQALDCVKTRTFQPAMKDGQPAETTIDTVATYSMDGRARQLTVSWNLGRGVVPGAALAAGGISQFVLNCIRSAPDAPKLAPTVTGPTGIHIFYDEGEIDHATVMTSSGVPALDHIALDCFAAVPKDSERAKTLEKTRSSMFMVPWRRLFPG